MNPGTYAWWDLQMQALNDCAILQQCFYITTSV